MIQLLLLAAGASPAGAPGTPAAAGSDGSGFGAVLGEFLGDKAPGVPVEATAAMASAGTAQGTQALQGAVPTGAEDAPESAGIPDGGAAAPVEVPADVPATTPAYVPTFGQILLSAPVLMPVAVPVPDDTPMTGAATAGPPDAESAGSLLTSAAATADVATPDDDPGETTPTASSALTANPGAATAAGPASAASPSVPAGPGSATLAAITAPAVSTTAAASSIPTSAATLAPEAGPTLGASPAPESSQVPATASAAFAPVLPAPLHGLPAVQPNTPAPLPDPGRLTPQLAGPLFSLASATPGQHVMTLKVSPEDLGPLTVRAHIDATGVRIELFAPGEAGRDALRSILPELRRGLAESGLGASLDLSDHGAPRDPGAGDPGQDRRAPQGSQPKLPSAATGEPAHPGRLRAAVVLPGTTPAVLDILV